MFDMRDSISPASLLSSSPSFAVYPSGRVEEIAARVIRELEEDQANNDKEFSATKKEIAEVETGGCNDDDEQSGSDSDEFEFNFVCRDPDMLPIPADEIISNGQIRPFFPIFKRDVHLEDAIAESPQASVRLPLKNLFGEDQGSSSSMKEEDEVTIPAGSYSVWTARSTPPSPYGCKKSNSTGHSKRWRLRDLLHRSSSEGKETFLFLSPSATNRKQRSERPKKEVEGPVKVTKGKSSDGVVQAHEIHYLQNRAKRENERHRSFLPYRQDIVGFFANVNGLSRNLQPF